MQTGELGKKLIEFYEGRYNKPYLCSASYVTGGIGHVIVDPTTKKKLKGVEGLAIALQLYPENIPNSLINEWLVNDLKSAENIVNRLVKVPITQYQFDALVSHVFNCGVSTTLFDLVNSVPPLTKSLKDWWQLHYTSAAGKKLPGLVKRRATEYELFITGKLNI